MKFILLLLVSLSIYSNPISKDCTFKGKKLAGRIKIVSHAADFTVLVRQYAADLNVKISQGSLKDCGEWQFVESGENFRIQIVNHAPDFSIKFVHSMPGLP